ESGVNDRHNPGGAVAPGDALEEIGCEPHDAGASCLQVGSHVMDHRVLDQTWCEYERLDFPATFGRSPHRLHPFNHEPALTLACFPSGQRTNPFYYRVARAGDEISHV